MSLTNNLVNTQPTLINVNLSNSDLIKLENINKTMSANIEIMNKRVDFLILKLIKLFLFLFQNKNESLTFDHIYKLK
jgi:hypothetical protein